MRFFVGWILLDSGTADWLESEMAKANTQIRNSKICFHGGAAFTFFCLPQRSLSFFQET
jgi:hypothetical protein